jgi:hypothetical protein
LPIKNFESSRVSLKALKLFVVIFSNVRTNTFWNFFNKKCTFSTIYSLCYLVLGLTLVNETNWLFFALGINNQKNINYNITL